MLRACTTAVLAQIAAGASSWPSSVPFWPRYDSRTVQVLNGTWAYGTNADCDPTSVTYPEISTPSTIAVPSSMDVAPPGILGPRFPCLFYRSSHVCSPGSTSLIKFYAVNHYARVFLDGAVATVNTAGGYTPFQVQSGVCSASGSREIAVVVANTLNTTLSPTTTGGDFYFYSGAGGFRRPPPVALVTSSACSASSSRRRNNPTCRRDGATNDHAVLDRPN
jgi:hypothetical protein